MPTSGAENVFAVPELLEDILLKLGEEQDVSNTRKPPEYLFNIIGVSRAFRDTIKGSAKLQRMMFLLPLKTSTTGNMDYSYTYGPAIWLLDSIQQNSILSPLLPGGLKMQHREDRYYMRGSSLWTYAHDLKDWTEGSYHQTSLSNAMFIDKYGGDEASWHRMPASRFQDADPLEIVFEVHFCVDKDSYRPDDLLAVTIRLQFQPTDTLEYILGQWQESFSAVDGTIEQLDAHAVERGKRDYAFATYRIGKLQDALRVITRGGVKG